MRLTLLSGSPSPWIATSPFWAGLNYEGARVGP